MQRHILQVFLSTLLALALSLAEAVAQTQPPCTPPPAPSNLTVTAASPTSISLAWNLPGPYTANFRIDVTDVTASINYPAIFTPATFVTISNLLSGHEHHIEVRAFYGPNCPLGPPAAANHATLTIIVDEIVGIQNCTPSNSNGIGIPQDRTACVGISGKKFPAADSDYNASVLAPGALNPLRYRIAYYPTGEAHVSAFKVIPEGYSLTQTGSAEAECRYYGELLFTLNGFSFSSNSGSVPTVSVNIFFSSACSYADCGSVNCNNDREMPGGAAPIHESHEQSTTPPSPNPFTASAVLRYELAAPTLVGVQLYDAIGHLIQTVQPATQLPEGEYTATVDGETLPSGAYFVVVQKGDQRQVFTLVKQ